MTDEFCFLPFHGSKNGVEHLEAIYETSGCGNTAYIPILHVMLFHALFSFFFSPGNMHTKFDTPFSGMLYILEPFLCCPCLLLGVCAAFAFALLYTHMLIHRAFVAAHRKPGLVHGTWLSSVPARRSPGECGLGECCDGFDCLLSR